MTIGWPSTSGAVLLLGNVFLVWCVVNYALPPSPTDLRGSAERRAAGGYLLIALRAVICGAAPLLFSASWRALPLGLLLLVLAIVLPLIRSPSAKRGLRAEWEFVGNVAALGGTALGIGALGLQNEWAPVSLTATEEHLAALAFLSAGALFLFRGAAQLVRGILEKTETMPSQLTTGAATGTAEFNRGRLIGYLERLLIVAIVIDGQFAALGLLIAAKGLIRSRELEHHEFAEYFLIGTLASLTVAFFVGLALRAVVRLLW